MSNGTRAESDNVESSPSGTQPKVRFYRLRTGSGFFRSRMGTIVRPKIPTICPKIMTKSPKIPTTRPKFQKCSQLTGVEVFRAERSEATRLHLAASAGANGCIRDFGRGASEAMPESPNARMPESPKTENDCNRRNGCIWKSQH